MHHPPRVLRQARPPRRRVRQEDGRAEQEVLRRQARRVDSLPRNEGALREVREDDQGAHRQVQQEDARPLRALQAKVRRAPRAAEERSIPHQVKKNTKIQLYGGKQSLKKAKKNIIREV